MSFLRKIRNFGIGISVLAIAGVWANAAWSIYNCSQRQNSQVQTLPVKTEDKKSENLELKLENADEISVCREDTPEKPDYAGKIKYSKKDILEITKRIYAEAANQPRLNRKIIAKMVLNRVRNPEYPETIDGVINERNTFSCTFDKKNKNWAQATGRLKMNAYERQVFNDCFNDVKYVLEGGKLRIPKEDEILAYHDVSIGKPKDKISRETGKALRYWSDLEPAYENGRLIFYAPKE